MSLRDKRWNVMSMLLLAVTAGCRMGVPLDRDVQISQHLGGSDSTDQPPPMRLASSNTPNLPASAASPARSESSPAYHRLSDTDPSDAAPSASQQATSIVFTDQPPADGATTDGPGDAAAEPDSDTDVARDDLAELIAALRDSPPEVQQQAIAQLVAAVGPRASKTEQPSDISEHLKLSLDTLPTLPDDVFDSPLVPMRLAATTQPTTTPAATPTNSVNQAVAAAADAPGTIAPASSTAPGPAEAMLLMPIAEQPSEVAATMLAPPAADGLKTAAEGELYAALLTRLQIGPPDEADGDRLRREIIKRYLLVLSGDAETAAAPLAGLGASEQKFLHNQLLTLGMITQAGGHPAASRRFAAALPQLRSAVQHLSEASEQLDLRSLAFCTEILSYGQVKRFTNNRFEAGQRVILYCEVDNFVAEQTADGYETELQGSYEIFDADGIKVASQVLPADRQLCDHYLRDYFIAYQMHLPGQLEPGEYRLELSMECVKGKKYGQSELSLVIKK